MTKLRFFIGGICLCILSACGSDSNPLNEVVVATTPKSKPKIFSGEKYLASTSVCADCNNNMLCESDEHSVISNEKGEFNFPDSLEGSVANCPKIAEVDSGLVDGDGKSVLITIASPASCGNLSPLSTLGQYYKAHQLTDEQMDRRFQTNLQTDLTPCTDYLHLQQDKNVKEKQHREEAMHLQKISKHLYASMANMQQQLQDEPKSKDFSEVDKHNLTLYEYDRQLDQTNKKIIELSQTENSSSIGKVVQASPSIVTNVGFPNILNSFKLIPFQRSVLEASFANVDDLFSHTKNSGNNSLFRYLPSNKNLRFSKNEPKSNISNETFEYQITPDETSAIDLESSVRYLDLSANPITSQSLSSEWLRRNVNSDSSTNFKTTFEMLEEKKGQLFINQGASVFQYILSARFVTANNGKVSDLMRFHQLPNWQQATLGGDKDVLTEADNTVAYDVTATVYNTVYSYDSKPNCVRESDDNSVILDLCAYVKLSTPQFSPTRDEDNSHFLLDTPKAKLTPQLYGRSYNWVADFIRLSGAKGGAVFVYNFFDGTARFFDRGTKGVSGEGVSYAGGVIRSGIPTMDDRTPYFDSRWETVRYHGKEVLTLSVPFSLRYRYGLAAKIHIVKVGNYYRFVERMNAGDTIYQNRLGVTNHTHSRILEAVKNNQIPQ